MRRETTYDLEERVLQYAASIIRVVDQLPNTRAAAHVGRQLLRSGTSPLPNPGEAQAAESRADFVHKLKSCLKELRESERWLKLMCRAGLCLEPSDPDPLLRESDELIRILASSIATTRARDGGGHD